MSTLMQSMAEPKNKKKKISYLCPIIAKRLVLD